MVGTSIKMTETESEREYSIRTMIRDARQSAVNTFSYTGLAIMAGSSGSSITSKAFLGIASAAAGVEAARTIRLFRDVRRR